MKRFLLVIALITMVIVTACNSGQVVSTTPTYSDPSESISVKANQSFIIALESNHTTGYAWQESHDAGMLTLLDTTYIPDSTSTNIVGAGGADRFTFKAIKTGQTTVTLTYSRSWAPSDTDTKDEFTVNVQ